jgi:hypothetical protein
LNDIIRGHAYEPPVDEYEEEAKEDEREEEVQEELIDAETGASVRRTRRVPLVLMVRGGGPWRMNASSRRGRK